MAEEFKRKRYWRAIVEFTSTKIQDSCGLFITTLSLV